MSIKNRSLSCLLFLLLFFSVTFLQSSNTISEEWPTRPVKLVVPFAAVGPTDALSRILVDRLSQELQGTFVIEYASGAGGMIGANRVASAAPDGYTLLMGSNTNFVLNQLIYREPLVDGAKDFSFVSLIAEIPRILIVRKGLQIENLEQFISYARLNAGRLQYGSAGIGSASHVCGLLIEKIIERKIAHVPYRGASLAIQDLLAGHIDYIPDQILTSIGLIEARQVNGVAILGPERTRTLPYISTSEEQGFDNLDCRSWSGLAFPRGTPSRIIEKLNNALAKIVDEPSILTIYANSGALPISKSRRGAEYFHAHVQTEIARWRRIVKYQ